MKTRLTPFSAIGKKVGRWRRLNTTPAAAACQGVTCRTLPWNTVGRCSVDLPGGEQLHGHGLEAQPENGLLLGHDCGARRSTQGQGAVGGTPPLAQSWGASHTLHSMVTGSSYTQGHAGALDTSWRHTGLVFSLLVHLRNFQSPGDFSFGRTFPPSTPPHQHAPRTTAPPGTPLSRERPLPSRRS